MNDFVHPKRLRFFMEQIYKDFPTLKSHPDYRFYYLYTDYPKQSEYLLVVTTSYFISEKFSNEINQSLHSYNEMFGFTYSSIMTDDDLNNKIMKDVHKLFDTTRGSHFTTHFCEVW